MKKLLIILKQAYWKYMYQHYRAKLSLINSIPNEIIQEYFKATYQVRQMSALLKLIKLKELRYTK